MANVQIKLSIREEALQQLEEALDEFPGSRTTNLIACEVIERYLPLWLEAERHQARKVKRQHAKVKKQLTPGSTKAAKKAGKKRR
jgi:hypothetical protein